MRFSVMTLLIAVAFCSVGFAALKFAGPVWWTILSGLSLLVFLAVAVVAFVGRDAMQATAIGLLVSVVAYGSLVALSGSDEFDPGKGWLPTTNVLSPVYNSIVKLVLQEYSGTGFRPQAGKEFVLDPSREPWPAKNVHVVRRIPEKSDFMAVGHLLWAMLLGLMGGLFGRLVFAIRTRAAADGRT